MISRALARPIPLIAAAALLAACGTQTRDTAAQSGPPKSGGTLTFAISSDAGCLDPQQVGSNDAVYSARQVVDSLTDQDPRTGKIVPWLAEKWEVGDGGRSFTFHLRTGATFSDGTPVDAAAVKASLDAAPKLGARANLAIGYLTGYAGTTVVDPQTAKVGFEQPNAQFLQASSTFSLGIVSPATAAKSADQRCEQGVVGSGPFVNAGYVPNQSITLTKRAGYAWGSSLWTKQGEAYLDRVVFRVLPESGVRVGALQSGQVDAIASVGPQDEAAIEATGDHLQARSNPGVVFNLGVNSSKITDPAVRKAISLGVNRQELVDTVLTKESKAATSILAATTPDYADLSADLAYDPDKAKSTLDAAGWTAGADGVRTKGGQKLDLQLAWFANLATNKPVLELLQQQLKAVGIGVELKEYPIANILTVQQGGQFDLLWGNVTRADPDILRTLYSTTLANAYRLPATGLDRTLTAQAGETDAAARAQLVGTAQREIVRNGYAIPVVELTTVLGISKDVHDLAFEASSRIQLHDTWKS